MLMLVFRVYAATVAVTLLSQMLTTARAQIHGIPLGDNELINTIILSVLPLANLVIAFDNLIMLFRSKPQFILRYMFVRSRLDEITIIKDGVIINTFKSISEASRVTGINRGNINQCCLKHGKRKTAGGYEWEYVG